MIVLKVVDATSYKLFMGISPDVQHYFSNICVVYCNLASGCWHVLNSCFVVLVEICVGVLKYSFGNSQDAFLTALTRVVEEQLLLI